MKKKILIITGCLAVCAAAIFSIGFNVDTNIKVSSLLKANIEALTDGEEGGGGIATVTCYTVFGTTVNPNGTLYKCGQISNDPNLYYMCNGTSPYYPAAPGIESKCYSIL